MHRMRTPSRHKPQLGSHTRGALTVTALLCLSGVGLAIAATPLPDSAYNANAAGKQVFLSILHNPREMTVQLNCGAGKNRWIWATFTKPVPIGPDGSFKATNVPTGRGPGTIPAGVPARIAAIQGKFTSTQLAIGKIKPIRSHGGCGRGYWSFRAKYAGHG